MEASTPVTNISESGQVNIQGAPIQTPVAISEDTIATEAVASHESE